MAKLGKASCLLMFVLLFASCSRPVPDSGKGVPILPSVGLKRSFSISTDVEVGSKAPIYAGDPMPLYFLRVDESAVGKGDFSDEISNQGEAGNLVFAEVPDYLASINLTPIHFNPIQIYLDDGRSTLMTGWHPQAEWYMDGSDLILEWTIDGSQDIMISNTQESEVENRKVMEFTFEHRLAQIQFYIKSESPLASTYWGNLTSIEMRDEPNAFEFFPSDWVRGRSIDRCFDHVNHAKGDLVVSGLPEEGLGIPYGDSVLVGCLMREAENENISNIRLTTTNRGVYTFPDNANVPALDPSFCEPGVATKVILNFKAGAVEITLEPAEWRDVNVDVALGAETYPFQTPGTNYIISRDVYGSAMDKWEIRDEKWETTPSSEAEISIPARMEVGFSDLSGGSAPKAAGNISCPQGWRLPTITELSLMQSFAATLDEPLHGWYLSGTCNARGRSYCWDMDAGTRDTLDGSRIADKGYKLRCIRDI